MAIIDGFHKALREEVDRLIQREYSHMISIVGDSVEQIALSHRYSQGFVRALTDVLTLCEQVENKLYKRDAA